MTCRSHPIGKDSKAGPIMNGSSILSSGTINHGVASSNLAGHTRNFRSFIMKVELEYTCKECNCTNYLFGGFWKWFFTPHFGAKKLLKCQHCGAGPHFMARKNWAGPNWLDWPVEKK